MMTKIQKKYQNVDLLKNYVKFQSGSENLQCTEVGGIEVLAFSFLIVCFMKTVEKRIKCIMTKI